MELKEEIKKRLGARRRIAIKPGPVPAAVLLPLFIKDGEYHVLFTMRTPMMTRHGGEISFPGGVHDPTDVDSVHTALREAWEEVGIPPEEVEVLGALDDFLSLHNYLVTPIVGIFPDTITIKINPYEIERIIEVPLSHFFNPKVLRTEQQLYQGKERTVYFYRYDGDEIWGLTARILKQFLDVLAGSAEAETQSLYDLL